MSELMRSTKIIATLGPQSQEGGALKELLLKGVDLVRVNFSHGTHQEQAKTLHAVQRLAKELGLTVGILADLCGPKIRIASFKKGDIELQEGQSFILDASLDGLAGDENKVGLGYKALVNDVVQGDILLLDDGKIVLKVTKTLQTEIHTEVLVGGCLGSKKGVNRKGGGLSAAALTEKDIEDIAFLADFDVDYIALSFPKSAQDILEAKQAMQLHDVHSKCVAKIERVEAIENIDAIIEVADAIMVARGDLGVELGFAQLPGVQKMIIEKSVAKGRPVITATQMMESMVVEPIPTRAEVSDVANAILDGTDGVMLSQETAIGKHPSKVVSAMQDICIEAEKYRAALPQTDDAHQAFTRYDEAIAKAAMYVANHLKVKAIVALTESGATPKLMSRNRLGAPIYALSRHEKTLRLMSLYKGVYPVAFDATCFKPWEITRLAVGQLVKMGKLNPGDLVIVTKGNIIGIGGKSNNLKIVTAESIV